MENRYAPGVDVPDYDEQISEVLADEFPDDEDEENWLAGGFADGYRIGIENRAGEVYRVFGVSMSEGITLHDRLHDLGLRNRAGELEGSKNGYHWLMRPGAES